MWLIKLARGFTNSIFRIRHERCAIDFGSGVALNVILFFGIFTACAAFIVDNQFHVFCLGFLSTALFICWGWAIRNLCKSWWCGIVISTVPVTGVIIIAVATPFMIDTFGVFSGPLCVAVIYALIKVTFKIFRKLEAAGHVIL